MPNKTTTHFSARKRLIVVAVAACFASAPAWSNPTAPQVVNGSAGFSQKGNLLTVNNSNGAIINWNTFSIGANETTRFNQTSASSSVLNRVLANDPTVLLGTLSSNGRVWLVNPAGIMVGQGARIDVAGFIASTLNVRNEDFLAGRLNFQATPNAGSIQNYGQITTPSGGSVYLVAPAVENYGVINAPNGEVILAAGQTVQLIDTGTPGVRVDITGAEGNVTNLGEIVSEAGRIGMAGVLVKNSGTLNASSLVKEGGRIFLTASQDAYVDGAGRIVATGTKGGSIEVLGNRVAVTNQAQLDASGNTGGGTVLVGGDFQGKNPEVQNAQISYFGPDAAIRADATQNGDGGKVIVWSDNSTRAYGATSARGGALGGNGGLVETSGHYLDVTRAPDIAAPQGKGGTWLLDPYDLTIDATSDQNISNTGSGAYFNYQGTGTPSVVTASTILTALSGGGNVTVSTSGSGTAQGNITVNATLQTNQTTSASLTLSADHDIVANAPILLGSNVDLNLYAANNISTGSLGGRYVNVNASAAATTGTVAATNSVTMNAAAALQPGDITAGSNVSLSSSAAGVTIPNISTTGGSINVSSFDDLSLGTALSSPNGVTLQVTKPGGVLTTLAGSSITDNTSVYYYYYGTSLTADDMVLGGSLNPGSNGTVSLNPHSNGRDINIGTGTVAGALNLSPAELGLISTTTGTLSIGNNYSYNGGNLTVSSPIAATDINAGTLNLYGRNISANAGIAVNGNISLQANNNLTAGSLSSGNSLSLSASYGNIATGNLSSGNAVTVTSNNSGGGAISTGTVSATNGVSMSAAGALQPGDITAGSNVSLSSSAAGVTIPNISTTGGSINVSSFDDLSLGTALSSPYGVTLQVTKPGGVLTTLAGSSITDNTSVYYYYYGASLTADDMVLGGSINPGSNGSVTLNPHSNGRDINIGTGTVAGALNLSPAELGLIPTTTGTLSIGNNYSYNGGNLTVSSPLAVTDINAGTLYLYGNNVALGASISVPGNLGINAYYSIDGNTTSSTLNLTASQISLSANNGRIYRSGTGVTNINGVTNPASTSTGYSLYAALGADLPGTVVAGDINWTQASGDYTFSTKLVGNTVTLSVPAGAVIHGNSLANDVTANTLNISVATGIGSGSPILTAVNVLNATSGGTGNIQINNIGNLTASVTHTGTGSLVLNNGGSLLANLISVPSGNVTLSVNGRIAAPNGISTTGNVSLNAYGNIATGNLSSGNSVNVNAGGAISTGTVSATNGVSMSAAGALQPGDITAGSSVSLTSSAAGVTIPNISTTGGSITVSSFDDLLLGTALSTPYGVTLQVAKPGGVLTTLSGSSITGNTLGYGYTTSLTADDMVLGGSLNNGSNGSVTLNSHSNGRDINIGTGTVAGALNLSPAELGLIPATTGTLNIGNSSTSYDGNLTVSSPLAVTDINAGTLNLYGRNISASAGIAVNGNISLQANNNLTAGSLSSGNSLSLSASYGNIATGNLSSGNAVSVTSNNSGGGAISTGTVSATNGVSMSAAGALQPGDITAGSSVSLTSSAAGVTIPNISTTGGSITVSSFDDLLLGTALSTPYGVTLQVAKPGGMLTTLSGSSITDNTLGYGYSTSLTADDMVLGGSLNNGSNGTVSLNSHSNGRDINIGTTTVAGALNLSPAELATITADTLNVGNNNYYYYGSDLTLSGPLAATDINAGTLNLYGRNISASAGIAVNGNISLQANNNITAGSLSSGNSLSLSASYGNIATGNLSSGNAVSVTSNNSGGGAISTGTVSATNGVSMSAAGALQPGDITAGGYVSLSSSAAGVTLPNISTTGSSINVSSFDDLSLGTTLSAPYGVTLAVAKPGGVLTTLLGSSITGNTGGYSISLTADDMVLGGSLNNGSSGTVTLNPHSTGRNINIGTTMVAGALNLTPSELGSITTGTLTIGNNCYYCGGDLTVSSPIAVTDINAGALNLHGTNVALGADISVPGNLGIYAYNNIDANTTSSTLNLAAIGNVDLIGYNGRIYRSGTGLTNITASTASISAPLGVDYGGTVSSSTIDVSWSSGDYTLGVLTGNTVNLNVTNGAIVDGNGSALNITANALNISATNGIGSGTGIQTAVAVLNATSGGSGDIQIANTGNLTVNNIAHSGTGSIILTNAGNLTLASASAAAGSITASAVGGSANVSGPISGSSIAISSTGTGGNISGSGAITTPGTATLTSSGDVSLNGANSVGALAIPSANNVTFNAVSALALNGMNITGALNLMAAGAISQSSPLMVGGSSAFSAGANPITLTDAGNAFTGAVALNNSGANDVALTNSGPLALASSSVGGNAMLSANGDINIISSNFFANGALNLTGTNLNVVSTTAPALLQGASMTATMSGNINVTGSASGRALIVSSAGSQTISAGGTISLTGGDGGSGNDAAIHSSGDQTVSASGITLTGGASGGVLGQGNYATLNSQGSQNITVGSGGLTLAAGGGGASNTDNYAMMYQGGTTGTGQTITVNGGGSIIMTGGSSGATSVGAGHGSRALIEADGDSQQISFAGGGAINLTGGTNGSRAFAEIYAKNGSQTISGSPSIALTGGASGGIAGEGNMALIWASAGAQAISASSIVLTGGNTGIDNYAQIGTVGNQSISVGSGGLSLTGGGGGLTDLANFASLYQSGLSGTSQTIGVGGGGKITLQGGSSQGTSVGANNGSLAFIRANGDSQSIDFTTGGAIDITGGTVGSENNAGIYAPNGTQTITGSPSITLTGGASGGIDGEGNYAGIFAYTGLQTIASGNMTLNAGAAGITNSAFVQSATQNITVHGNLALTGGGSSAGTLTGGGAGIGGRGGSSATATNLTLAVDGDLTLTGGSVAGASIGSGYSGGQTTDMTITVGGNVALNPGTAAGAGSRIGSPSGAVAGGDISLTAGGSIALNAGTGIRTGGNVAVKSTGSLDVGGGISADGMLTVDAGGNLTLGGGAALGASAAGDALVLAAAGNFINNAGASALSAPNGRWLVYSTNPTLDTRGGLVYDFKQYGMSYTETPYTGLGTGNGFIYSVAPTITPSLTGSTSKVYDGTTVASLTPANYATAGALDNDTIVLDNPATGNYIDKNAGTGKSVSTTVGFVSAYSGVPSVNVYGYQFANSFAPPPTTGSTVIATTVTTVSGNIGQIDPAPLTVSATGQNKVYDATPAATVSLSDNRLSGDVLALAYGSAAFADKNVGTAKPVAVSGISLAGTDAGNYTVNPTASTAANITPATLGVSGISASNKIYDGNTAATLNIGSASLSGVFAGDNVTVTAGAGSFADKNIGTAKPVTVSGISLAGTDGSNYILSGVPIGLSANITQLASVAWTGGATGNWSQASNWAGGALPDGSNVLAVTIPSGSTVTYDPGTTAANTTLNTLISSGVLTLAGGAGSILTVNSQLTTPQFTMTSGSLTGTGNLTVGNSFSQSGGSISLTGNASAAITQTTGDLIIGSLAAPTVSLTAQSGSVSQSGPIVASALVTKSVTGTDLSDAGNQVSSFTATNSGSGNVALTNTGVLSIGGISNTNGNITVDNTGAVTTAGAVSAPAGAVSIVAHSPLTIGTGGVSSGGNITLTAGATSASTDNLTLNGVVQTTGSTSLITLLAGDNLVQNANVTTNGGAVNATAQTGSITMAPGATTSTSGGSISYTPSSGNATLSSLDATSGAIALSAGGSITPAAGFSGANLTGGTATIAAGGSVNLTTNVKLLDTTGIQGTFSIFDQSTGGVLTNAPAAAASSTTTTVQGTTDQVLSTVVATTLQQPLQTTTQTTIQTQLPPTAVVGGSGSTLLSNSTQTIGGTADTFGGSSSDTSSSGTSSSGQSGKPAGDKKDDDKKQGEGTAAKKDEGKPAAKKLATCS